MLKLGLAIAVMFGSAIAAIEIGMRMRDLDAMTATAYLCGVMHATESPPSYCQPYRENAARFLPAQ